MRERYYCKWCGAPIHRARWRTRGGAYITRWAHPEGKRIVCQRIRDRKLTAAAARAVKQGLVVQRALPFS